MDKGNVPFARNGGKWQGQLYGGNRQQPNRNPKHDGKRPQQRAVRAVMRNMAAAAPATVVVVMITVGMTVVVGMVVQVVGGIQNNVQAQPQKGAQGHSAQYQQGNALAKGSVYGVEHAKNSLMTTYYH